MSDLYGRRFQSLSALLLATLLTCTWPTATRGADPNELSLHSSFLAQVRNVVQFRLISGRIVCATTMSRGNSERQVNSGGRTEKLTVAYSPRGPNLIYELHCEAGDIKLTSSDDQEFTIVREPKTDGGVLPLTFTQDPLKGITLTVGTKGAEKTYTAPSLWHLLLAEPQVAREQLVPLLEPLRADWKLLEQVQAVEGVLLRSAAAAGSVHRVRWSELVAELSNESFATRESADRQLRQDGQAALDFLLTLRPQGLDAEQWFRVRRIIAAVSNDALEDVPERVAPRLMDDPRIWFALLKNEAPPVRRAALERLQSLLGRQLAFDPNAAPEVRQAQWEKLASVLELAAPATRGE